MYVDAGVVELALQRLERLGRHRDRDVLHAAESFGHRFETEAGEVEEREHVAGADVEEEVRSSPRSRGSRTARRAGSRAGPGRSGSSRSGSEQISARWCTPPPVDVGRSARAEVTASRSSARRSDQSSARSRVAMPRIIARGCTAMKIGVSLRSGYAPMDVRTGARWMIERARAAADAGLDSLFVGDHHNVPVPYYQNVPMLGRLLAEWDDRPAGALFLLPLWHPVLLAEQIGTLASIAEGPFIMQCAVGGGAEQFDALGVSMRDRGRRASKPRSTSSAACARAKRCRTDAPWRDRARPHRADPARAARGVDRRRGAHGDRPCRAPRRRVPHRSRSDARAGRASSSRSTARRARATAVAPARDRGPPRRPRRRRRRRRRPRRRARSLDRGYRGFDPAAPVVGRSRARSPTSFARPRRDRAAPT